MSVTINDNAKKPFSDWKKACDINGRPSLIDTDRFLASVEKEGNTIQRSTHTVVQLDFG